MGKTVCAASKSTVEVSGSRIKMLVSASLSAHVFH